MLLRLPRQDCVVRSVKRLVGQGVERPSRMVTVRMLPLDISMLPRCSESPEIWVFPPLWPFHVSQAPVLSSRHGRRGISRHWHSASPRKRISAPCQIRSRGITLFNA
ncbi:unnamed protein product [Coccothraustes coccothraustes]